MLKFLLKVMCYFQFGIEVRNGAISILRHTYVDGILLMITISKSH